MRAGLRIAQVDALVYIRAVARAALITGYQIPCNSC
jgi:hypothetical protein